MNRKPNTVGGGQQTNLNGLKFERETDLVDWFNSLHNFHVTINPDKKLKSRHGNIYNKKNLVGYFFEQDSFHLRFCNSQGIHWKEIFGPSSKLKPDAVFVNIHNKTIYIIEKKYQSGGGSVDEKLQTCDYKKKTYTRLLQKSNFKVELYYVLNDWFDNPNKQNVFKYMKDVGCKYFINIIPLKELGL